MKVLITGVTGFVGSHLADYLLSIDDIEVYGIVRWRSKTDNVEHIKDKVTFIECDIRDGVSVDKTIKDIKPDRIFHLAAQSFVPTSWHAPQETITTNIVGELNVFEAVKSNNLKDTIIQIAGSSEEYGLANEDELPIRETNTLRPLSPYAVSKVGQDLLAYQYYKSYNIKTIRTRAFNHTGPRRGDVFVTSNFARQIAEIEKKKREPVIYVGNLDAKRDYTDVRDIVKAYWLATEECIPGEVYNICSGKAYPIQKVLDMLLSLSKVEVTVEQDEKRMRPSDVPVLLGDNTKFCNQTGWKPEIPFNKTLEDLLEYWRERV